MKYHVGECGQALITMLVFVIIAVTMISAAVVIMVINSTSSSKYEQGIESYYVAESGIENALLRLLRNPTYPGETLAVGNGTVIISVSGSNPKVVIATGTVGSFVRKLQAEMSYNNGYYSFAGWKEIE